MKKLKNLIRSRRGIAIEFAIGIMLVSVAISTILLSTAVLEGERKRADLDELKAFINESESVSEIVSKIEDDFTNPIKNYEYSDTENDNVKEVLEDGTHIATVTLENKKVKFIQLINSN